MLECDIGNGPSHHIAKENIIHALLLTQHKAMYIWHLVFLLSPLTLDSWLVAWSVFHMALDSITLLESWLTHWLKHQPSVNATDLMSPFDI